MIRLIAAVTLLLISFGANAAECPAAPKLGLPAVSIEHSTEVCHTAYVSMVDNDLRIPRWVAYELTAAHNLGCAVRANNFHGEEAVDKADRADKADYDDTGYDLGHQMPAARSRRCGLRICPAGKSSTRPPAKGSRR